MQSQAKKVSDHNTPFICRCNKIEWKTLETTCWYNLNWWIIICNNILTFQWHILSLLSHHQGQLYTMRMHTHPKKKILPNSFWWTNVYVLFLVRETHNIKKKLTSYIKMLKVILIEITTTQRNREVHIKHIAHTQSVLHT